MKSIQNLLQRIRLYLQGDTTYWLIAHKDERLFLECIMKEPEGHIMLQRWVRNPARAYIFNNYQKGKVDKNGQLPELGFWRSYVELPLYREETR